MLQTALMERRRSILYLLFAGHAKGASVAFLHASGRENASIINL
jgi:hypothetical protein